jgi:phosphoenolpyruvate synthase/pyruvate phosphate dikinase
MIRKDKYLTPRDRVGMLSPNYWNCVVQTHPKLKKIYGKSLKIVWMKIYHNDGHPRQLSIYLKKDFENTGQYIARKLIGRKGFFEKLEKGEKNCKKEALQFIRKIEKTDLTKITLEEILKTAKELKKVWIEYDLWTVPAWFFAGDQYKKLLEKKLNLPEADFLFLSDPLEKTHTSKLEEAILKGILIAQEYVHKIQSLAAGLSKKFGWIPFGYDGPQYWDTEYFIAKIKEGLGIKEESLRSKINEIKERDRNIRNKYKKLIKKYGLNAEEKRLIGIMHAMAVWTDDRKALDYRLNYHYARILHEMEKRCDIPFKNLKYLFLAEFPDIEKKKEAIIKATNKRISRGFVIEYKNGRGGIISKKKQDKIFHELEDQIKNADIISGMVACRGEKQCYQGTAKVLFSAKEERKINEGDFLIATMTTPDYILAMRKAAGFITDEGGVTCHAAIVAREMNKPCIIGTKIATKVLKDGDLVEVDAGKGAVRIVKIMSKK